MDKVKEVEGEKIAHEAECEVDEVEVDLLESLVTRPSKSEGW